MPKAYWVACYRKVSDVHALERYSALATSAIQNAGGRFLSRSKALEAHEAGWLERTVIVEFESLTQAIAAYQTESYQKALAQFDGKVERDFRILEGLGD